MKTHELKLNQKISLSVWAGYKQFEIRKNDRDYQFGDRIRFRVVDDEGNYKSSLLDNKLYEITHVLTGCGLEPGYVALGIREVDA